MRDWFKEFFEAILRPDNFAEFVVEVLLTIIVATVAFFLGRRFSPVAKLIGLLKRVMQYAGEEVGEKAYNDTEIVGFLNSPTLTLEQLVSINGVGPVLAKRIFENRPYDRSDDLVKLPRIGEETLEKIKRGITAMKPGVQPTDPASGDDQGEQGSSCEGGGQ